MTYDWMVILPPLVALAVVLWQREVVSALLLAVLTAELLLQTFSVSALPLAGIATIERCAAVFADADNTRILLFSLLIGALLALLQRSGGVTALVGWLIDRGIARSPRQAALLTSGVGCVIFIEGNLSALTSGILARGLFDRFKLGRARLAYLVDSTTAPVCILVLLNAWGAFLLVLLAPYELPGGAAATLWSTLPYNFYALIALALVFYTAWTGRVHGPLARSGEEARVGTADDIGDLGAPASSPAYMLVPLVTLVLAMIGFMFWTGNGSLTAGSGSRSVLYAVCLALVVAWAMLVSNRRFSHRELVQSAFRGMGELLPLVAIVLFSLALGSSLKELGTGPFMAGLVGDYLPGWMVLPMLFLAGSLISFSTGTSWGTFAILIPIGMPLIPVFDLPPALLLAAILGGGVFGDHCSPISDTTVVASLASGCDLFEHVRTQLPYALFAGAATLLLYTVAGVVVT